MSHIPVISGDKGLLFIVFASFACSLGYTQSAAQLAIKAYIMTNLYAFGMSGAGVYPGKSPSAANKNNQIS